ncbi:MAG: hypothetical protein J7577_06010 [Sphingobacteriaceae bacterium]|nr:hypothetical protein [Sphingobacteriaceae bacterium]
MESGLMPSYLLPELMLIYACWSIVIFFLSRTKFINQSDMVAVWLIRIVGIVYLLYFLVEIIFGGQASLVWINRYAGPYWLAAVFPVLMCFLATQSLWMARFRFSKYWRLVFGLLLVIGTFFNDILVWFNDLQSNHHSSPWCMLYQSPFLHIQSIIVFSLVIGVGYFILNKK